ncbi:MAG: Gldg family protein, partial [Candidatus Rokuibacteriota bacterium]
MSAVALNLAVLAVVFLALAVLFVFGLTGRLPVAGPRRLVARVAMVAAAVATTVLANVALARHDVHLDVTPSRSFTPSRETLGIVRGLTNDVGVTYFYQKHDRAGWAAKTMVEVLGRTSPHLRVRTIDPDQHPALASQFGVRAYNVAVIESEGRRVQVVTTGEGEIGLAILRATRRTLPTLCFAVGHGEYDIDDLAPGRLGDMPVPREEAAPEERGAGGLRQALEALGSRTLKVMLATTPRMPEECAVFMDLGPRTLYTAHETDVVRDYLGRGGAALLLYDVGFPVEAGLAALLASAGVKLGDGLVVDPHDHHVGDERVVAVSRYTEHPITRNLALAFFPGVRPLEALAAEGVRATALFSSSFESYLRPAAGAAAARGGDPRRGARVLAVA